MLDAVPLAQTSNVLWSENMRRALKGWPMTVGNERVARGSGDEDRNILPGVASPSAILSLQNKFPQGTLIAICLFLVYYATSNMSSPFNQYPRLADSFMHGRLYLEHAPTYLELARYYDNGMPCTGSNPGCMGYVIDPPAPAVLLMPFVAAFGPDLNQVLVSIAVSAAAMGLFWVAARQMGWSTRLSVAITVLLALGTNFWWAAGDGSAWQFAHVCSVFFMMAALVEATGRKRPFLVGLLLGLSGLSRLPAFLAFPFFLYLLLQYRGDQWEWREVARSREAIRRVLFFAGGPSVMVALMLLYNYARFGTIIDLGYAHPQYLNEPWFAKGRFDISYVPRHIQAIFYLGPNLDENRFPFFKPSEFGMALFMVTPAFLYLFAARVRRLEVAAAVAMGLVMIPHLLHGTTGWTQFGYRYSMDYLPMLAVLTASGMRYRIETRRKWLIIGLSVVIAVWGPLYFFHTRLEDMLSIQWNL